MHTWSVGDHLTHRFNPELGIGRVTAVEGRVIVAQFAAATLRLASTSDALVPADADAPQRERSPLERLAAGHVDVADDFLTRLDILHLLATREADGLGSFLGGRVRLFPHQLHVAEHATARLPVRWLLADEVGLGKTIEAALIMNHLLHREKIERCLVVAPEALTVQWLGELWRKYHQVFTILDAPRLADVERDFGAGFNPFDVHRRAVVALETLVQRPELTTRAVEAGIDLLVVDEAQRLRRPAGHPGEPTYRAVAPIAALGRHVLLLSATPLEDNAHGFFRLLQLLRPDEFPESTNFDARLASGVPLPPCTSSTRRVDIGGLPPRVPIPIDVSPVADPRGADDTRLEWLLTHAKRWKRANEKALVFVSNREVLDRLRDALSRDAQLASGLFHEDLSAARRDTEVALFRSADGPSILVSTEAGGEGRNFEFCRRLVLYDLPWKPSTVEQRIGRLDRIGRRMPVEIIYFRPQSGIEADVVRLFERLGLFREPMAGLEPQLGHLERALETLRRQGAQSLSDEQIVSLIADAQVARTRIHEAAYHQLHRDPYRAELGPAILARVPPDLDALIERVVTAAAARLGFAVEQVRGRRAYAIEFGNEAVIDSLPGVPGGSSFVGTFDREFAVEDETIDFFSSGHALVEGLLAHFEEDPKGRVARLELRIPGGDGRGLVAIYKDGPQFEVRAIDSEGRERPDWAEAFRRQSLRASRMKPADVVDYDWPTLTTALGDRVAHAVAAIVVRGS